MKQKTWFKFEIIYQKINPLSFEKKSKLYTNYQSSFAEKLKDAEEQAIKFFELERFGDKLVSIRCVNE
jgi:hypothetical protein